MTRPPPIPPANQPKKARDLDSNPATSKDAGRKTGDPAARKGRHDNINQNTHNQGYQQDR